MLKHRILHLALSVLLFSSLPAYASVGSPQNDSRSTVLRAQAYETLATQTPEPGRRMSYVRLAVYFYSLALAQSGMDLDTGTDLSDKLSQLYKLYPGINRYHGMDPDDLFEVMVSDVTSLPQFSDQHRKVFFVLLLNNTDTNVTLSDTSFMIQSRAGLTNNVVLDAGFAGLPRESFLFQNAFSGEIVQAYVVFPELMDEPLAMIVTLGDLRIRVPLYLPVKTDSAPARSSNTASTPPGKTSAKTSPQLPPYLALTYLAELSCSEGKYEEAQDYALKAVTANPGFGEAYWALGRAYEGLGRADEAIDVYKKALTLDPGLAEAHFTLGTLYIRQKKLESGVAELKQAVKYDPKLPEAHLNLGLGFLLLGDKASALSEYQVLQSLDNDMAEKLFSLIY